MTKRNYNQVPLKCVVRYVLTTDAKGRAPFPEDGTGFFIPLDPESWVIPEGLSGKLHTMFLARQLSIVDILNIDDLEKFPKLVTCFNPDMRLAVKSQIEILVYVTDK